jgi:hypothetical protein
MLRSDKAASVITMGETDRAPRVCSLRGCLGRADLLPSREARPPREGLRYRPEGEVCLPVSGPGPSVGPRDRASRTTVAGPDWTAGRTKTKQGVDFTYRGWPALRPAIEAAILARFVV